MAGPALSTPRSLGLASLAAGIGLALGACFVEPAQPSTFRFECSADADCEDGSVCASGLCQQPCGAADDDPCPPEGPVCLNGYCSSICPISADPCPEPQVCTSLAAPGEEPGESGVCIVACEDDGGCPEGSVCFPDFGGLCVASCASAADCGSGEECLGGFCVPSSSGGGFP